MEPSFSEKSLYSLRMIFFGTMYWATVYYLLTVFFLNLEVILSSLYQFDNLPRLPFALLLLVTSFLFCSRENPDYVIHLKNRKNWHFSLFSLFVLVLIIMTIRYETLI